MDTYSTEDEQIAAIKNWFKKDGLKTLIAVVVISAAFFGYHYHQDKKQADLEKASILYTQLIRVMDQGLDNEEKRQMFDEIYGYISTDFEDSIYASFSAFMRASVDVQDGDYEKAQQTLEWILARKNKPEIDELARLRLARVKASNDQVDEALALIDKGTAFFPSEYAETKGDILAIQGKSEEALAAYEKAKEASHNERPGTILDIKINQLKEDPESTITLKPEA